MTKLVNDEDLKITRRKNKYYFSRYLNDFLIKNYEKKRISSRKNYIKHLLNIYIESNI